MSRFTLMALGVGGAVAVLLIVLAMQLKGPAGNAAPETGTSTSVPVGAPAPQPPGEAPPGKVWSPEHGHWHDVSAPVGTVPAPAGTAPATGGP